MDTMQVIGLVAAGLALSYARDITKTAFGAMRGGNGNGPSNGVSKDTQAIVAAITRVEQAVKDEGAARRDDDRALNSKVDALRTELAEMRGAANHR